MRVRLAAILSVALLIMASAGPRARAQTPGASQIDWNKIDSEALGYFQNYLRYDTTNPPSNTAAAIAYLKGILDSEGIATATFESKPGMVSLVARIPGPASEKPFLMMSHADVVPAVASNWSHPPFSADLTDGYVWARGAIDNKAHGIMALMTLLAIKRQGIPLRRGIEMMVNPDEEAGGANGAEWMVKNHFESIEPAFAVNEGGSASPDPFGSGKLRMAVAVAEKRVMWLKLIARGKSGHGSIPINDNPNLIMIRALGRLLREQPPMRLTPVLQEAMTESAPYEPFPASFELAHPELPFMLDMASRGPLRPNFIQALLRDTISPTMLTAGNKVNVIPSSSEAGLDCRLLPGTNADAFLNRMRDLLADSRISIDFIQRPDQGSSSPASGEPWDAMRKIVGEDFKNTFVVPWMTAGGTDSRFLREKGVPSYGFIPVIVGPGEIARVHGVDERLSVDNLNLGIKATYDLAIELCARR